MRSTTHARDVHGEPAPPRRTRFADRYEAGEVLAARIRQHVLLSGIDREELVIVAVTEGGLPFAYYAALELGSRVEAAPVAPLHAPHQRSVRIGMVVDDGTLYIDERLGDRHGARGTTLDHLVDRAASELAVHMRELDDEPGVDVAGASVLVVDDAIDSGITAIAVADWLRRNGAAHVVYAAAVATPHGLDRMRGEVDAVITLAELDEGEPPAWSFAHADAGGVADSARLMTAIRELERRRAVGRAAERVDAPA